MVRFFTYKNNSRRMVGLVVAFTVVTTLSACGAAAGQAGALPSDGPMFIYDRTDTLAAPDATFAWNVDAYANPNATGDYAGFSCPETSEGGFSFLSEVGEERSPEAWRMSAQLGFSPGTHSLLAPMITPDWLINGDNAAVKAQGGDYSLGFACVENNGLTATRVFFRHIRVTGGTGEWRAEPDERM